MLVIYRCLSIFVLKVFYALYLSFSMYGVKHGTGRHYFDVSKEDYEIAMRVRFKYSPQHRVPFSNTHPAIQAWWFCYPWYGATMIMSKLSIGFFMLRVSVKRMHIWLIWAIMIVTLFAGIAFFFASLFQCNPIWYFWSRYNGGSGTCIDLTIMIALAYVYSVFAIVSDLTMALFPALLISSLNMNRKTKILLIPLMAMGTM